ncbi:MAG: hypothetical protein U1E76_18825 [Planctomycetota bacterium]
MIELRSDPRYGELFRHAPASARIHVGRDGQDLVVGAGLRRRRSSSGCVCSRVASPA